MQTYLPYSSFQQTVKCLDYRRLGCQRKEAMQILQILRKGKVDCGLCKRPQHEWTSSNCIRPSKHKSRLTPWYHHPAVQMWKGHERLLALYGIWCVVEWKERGYEDTCEEKINELAITFPLDTTRHPWWLGNEKFHAAYRSNLLRKLPSHYRKIWPDEPDDLPYFWPTKNLPKFPS